ncbi:hypothetical protein XANCAGTX0491_006833 [Xanthoria calcicola]
MVHTCNISLCMSSIGNSSLARIEISLLQALERQEASQDTTDTAMELAPIARSQTEPAGTSRTKELSEVCEEPAEPKDLGLRRLERAFTGATLVEPPADLTSDLTPPMSDEDVSESGSPPAGMSKAKPIGTGRKRKASTFNVQDDVKASLPSPTAAEENPEIFPNRPSWKRKASLGRDMPSPKGGKDKLHHDQDGVMDVVADAMNELAEVRQKEQSARPLRIVREDPLHQVDDSLKRRFQQLAEEESRIRRLSAKDWLRVATWWLLKARSQVPELQSHSSSIASLRTCNGGTSQAYVDLLKSSWILHAIILDENNVSSLMTDENRKLFYNLSDGVNEDLSKYQPPDTSQRQALMNQNTNIWELLQPEEETSDTGYLLPRSDNQRWITVEQDDVGAEDETVLYRTFVNAAIGSKKYRIKSRGAPYMLILSTTDGESQPKITIGNQSGTISLTRDITPDDVQDGLNHGSPSSGDVDVKDGIPLNFGKMNLTVAFVGDGEQQRFMDFPRTYFNAVKRREPRQIERATETLLFNRSVEIFEQLKPATLKPLDPRQQWRSCDLRVLETTCKEGWRTTRRLAISSSAGERRPWCTDIFLPLSNVRISRKGTAREAIIKWSDCTHEQSDRTDGNYNRMYSYIYDENNPNIALRFLFKTSADATDFENTVLKLSNPPIFSSSAGPDSRLVYNMSDTETLPKNYKGILLTQSRLDWKYSDLVYIYRDTDFIHDSTANRVRFPHVYYTDYISSHTEKLYKPDPGTNPHFSHCEKKVGNINVEFDDESTMFKFMSALTTNYDLIFSRPAHSVATKAPRKFGSTKSNKGQAQVQLWQERRNTSSGHNKHNIRLVSRWDGPEVEHKWLSLPIRPGTLQQQSQTKNDHSRKLDLKNLAATDSKKTAGRNGEGSQREGPVTICSESVKDREEFAAAVAVEVGGGKEMKKSPFDELMGLT